MNIDELKAELAVEKAKPMKERNFCRMLQLEELIKEKLQDNNNKN